MSKIHRNPIARDLHSKKYANRIVSTKKAYSRKNAKKEIQDD